jgi:hypothetical protein
MKQPVYSKRRAMNLPNQATGGGSSTDRSINAARLCVGILTRAGQSDPISRRLTPGWKHPRMQITFRLVTAARLPAICPPRCEIASVAGGTNIQDEQPHRDCKTHRRSGPRDVPTLLPAMALQVSPSRLYLAHTFTASPTSAPKTTPEPMMPP